MMRGVDVAEVMARVRDLFAAPLSMAPVAGNDGVVTDWSGPAQAGQQAAAAALSLRRADLGDGDAAVGGFTRRQVAARDPDGLHNDDGTRPCPSCPARAGWNVAC